jgi:hypothetical protein
MSILNKLTEGIVRKDVRKEGAALLNKWEQTGLLEGLESDRTRRNMAMLLENQAKQLLKETSAMSAGDVEGFASVAFPIVRRVFGGLIANDLVSVQPMSLPSGLIFFLDFTYTDSRMDHTAGNSLYGGQVVGRQLTGGVDISGVAGAQSSFYSLNNGYSSPTRAATVGITAYASGTVGGAPAGLADAVNLISQQEWDRITRLDPDLSGTVVAVGRITTSDLVNFNADNLIAVTITSSVAGNQVRRLSQHSASNAQEEILIFTAASSSDQTARQLQDSLSNANVALEYPVADNFVAADALGAVVGAAPWALESDATVFAGVFTDTATGDIPEIDIKVDSISVTAVTKKLKAKWTPELGQDLNAYHNMDAEVELTSVLSEQIALEIDREIVTDLVQRATADTMYWSRRPGRFIWS